MLAEVEKMPEERICSFSGDKIEPGTGMMFVKRDGSVLWFKDSKSRKNHIKTIKYLYQRKNGMKLYKSILLRI